MKMTPILQKMKCHRHLSLLSVIKWSFCLFLLSFTARAETRPLSFSPGDNFLIVNNTSNKTLTLEYATKIFFSSYKFVADEKDGASYIAEGEIGGRIEDFQKWKFVDLCNNTVQIINVKTGKAIDVVGGEPIQREANSHHIGQHWKVVHVSDEKKQFISLKTGEALSLCQGEVMLSSSRNNIGGQYWKVRLFTPRPNFYPITVESDDNSRKTTVTLTTPSIFRPVKGAVVVKRYTTGSKGVEELRMNNVFVPSGTSKQISLDISNLKRDDYILYLHDTNSGTFQTRLFLK